MDVGHEFRDLHHGGSLVGAERFRCHCPESLNRDSATRVCASCRRYVRCCIPRQARRILMSSHQHSTTDLPITGKLTIHFAYAMAILVLLLTASVAGVLYSRTVYPVDDLRRMFLPNDVVNLSIGLPFLTVSLLLIWRDRLAGLLALPGALFFILYNSLIYVLALPFGMMLLLHFSMVLLSACASVILVTRIDASAVRRHLAGAVPAKSIGAILTGLGALFFLRALGVVLSGMTLHTPLARPDFAVGLVDLLITPLWISGGLLLILRRAFGYVAATALLFQSSMLFLALIAFLVLQPSLTGTPFRWVDIIVVFVMGLTFFVPLVLLLEGVRSRQRL